MAKGGVGVSDTRTEPLSATGRGPEPGATDAVHADADLGTALDALVSADSWGLPVIDASGAGLSGWITHQAVLAAAHSRPAPAGANQ